MGPVVLVRRILKGAAMVSATALIYAGWRTARVISPAKFTERLRRLAVRLWARSLACIVRMRIHKVGNLPAPPFLLVANHLGYLDIVTLAAVFDCTFVARGDLADWPMLGRLASDVGTIFVDRDRRADVARVSTAIESEIEKGRGVVLFPEGTSTDGSDVGEFRSSLLEPAAKLQMPVHYAALSYAAPDNEESARTSVCWWGDMALLPHLLKLFSLSRIEARVEFGATPIVAAHRKQLAAALHSGITRIFVPVQASLPASPRTQAHAEVIS